MMKKIHFTKMEDIHAEFAFLTTTIYYPIKSAAYSPGPCMSGAERSLLWARGSIFISYLFHYGITV